MRSVIKKVKFSEEKIKELKEKGIKFSKKNCFKSVFASIKKV